MQGKVEICGVNTARLPVLKNEEMMALLRRTKEGDRAAREQLICGNLRLVLSVIQRFLGRGENVDDLFQVGCIGLIKAIVVFGPCRFFGLFGRGEDYYIPWECVQKFGCDIVIVDKPFQRRDPPPQRKKRRWGG